MMGKRQNELGALAVSQICRRGINFVGGVAGLAINVTKSGGRSWILRYQVGGKRRDMGLGGYPDVTLAEARVAARAVRGKIAAGVDPIEDSRTARSKMIAAQDTAITFSQAAKQYIDTHESGWRNTKHVQQWRSTLQTYADPVIGKMLVRDVGLAQVLKILEPIWRTKTETASRLRGRIESILDWAAARSYRAAPNPARWKGHLDKLLPAPGKIAKTDHHQALPYDDLPEFIKSLAGQQGIGARALEFTILTASRSGEVRGAKWDEFDLKSEVWTVPAVRMKAGKEHRVPLSNAALAIIKAQKETAFCDYVFPSSHGSKVSEAHGSPLSDMTLSAVLRRMKIPAVPHGFRSTFRDWCAEKTDYPRDVAEMALAHAIGNKVEAAYRRGDLFDKRKQLMKDWADYAYPQVGN
ncbi:MAG: integrase arm-type DNA-binding domain-containing protein [Gallionella sp.]|jgi:integrase